MTPKDPLINTRRYYDALKLITRFESAAVVLRTAEARYGLSPKEALEYAYDNMRAEAHRAIKGRRRPANPPQRGAA